MLVKALSFKKKKKSYMGSPSRKAAVFSGPKHI